MGTSDWSRWGCVSTVPLYLCVALNPFPVSHNVDFYSGESEKILPMLYKQNIMADVVILDPPRKGCEKQVLDTIIEMSPARIVYVSCNPQTLSRDIKILESGGYELKTVQPLDQFPWTTHVECVVLISRV